jgi:hypothetical protein
VAEPAYAHYTVSRDTSRKPADPKRMFVQALRWGWRGFGSRLRSFLRRERRNQVLIDPKVAMEIADVVVIKDLTGAVVLSETFDNPFKSEARHNQITSDLLSLTVELFRETYGLPARPA